MTEDEFIDMSLEEKTVYAVTEGVNLSAYMEGNIVFFLYKCPQFYAEFEYNARKGYIIDIVTFNDGWKLDKHVEKVDIELLFD